jgi:hypothetical protein
MRINSTIKTKSNIIDDVFVDAPSVLYTSYKIVGSKNIIVRIGLLTNNPAKIPISAIIVSIVHIVPAYLKGFAIILI